jgi:putative transposase
MINLGLGEILSIENREYEFRGAIAPENAGADQPDDLLFIDRRTGRPRPLPAKEFDRLYALGEVRWVQTTQHPADRPDRPPDEDGGGTDVRHIRRHYLTCFDESGISKSDRALGPFIAACAKTLDCPHTEPSPTTLRRWLRERGEPGDRRLQCMGDRFRRGPQAMRIASDALKVLAEKAEAFWDNDPHIQSIDIYHAVRTELIRHNAERAAQGLLPVKIPSRTTVWRYLRRQSDFDHMRRRWGARAANRWFKSLKGSLNADRILDKAIIDGTWLDCTVLDDEQMILVGRPYLVVIVDVKSRYPLAFVLSFVPESLETVMACLRQAVRPKWHINERYPHIVRLWVAYGVPRVILVDNAWQYIGASFVDACADANISVEWAPVRTPEYKGIVERLFRTLNDQLIHKLPGGIPLKPHQLKQLGIEEKVTGPILTLAQINELITQYIVDVYGPRPHRALKMSPEAMWRKQEVIDGIPYAKDLPALDRALGRVVAGRTLTHKGVEFLGLTYRSLAVDELLNDLLPRVSERQARRGTVKVKLKYHPEDLSKIFVWNEVRRHYVELPCVDTRYAQGLSEHHHQRIRAFSKAQQEAFCTEDERCAARVRLRETMLSFMSAAGLRDRRRMQRSLSPYGAKGGEPRTEDAVVPHNAGARSPHEIPVSTTKNRRDGERPSRSVRRGRTARRKVATNREHAETSPAASPPTINPLEQFDFDVGKLLDAAKAEGPKR